MSELYDYLSDTGIILPDTSTIQADVEEEFQEALDPDIDLSPETPQGRLIALITKERASVLTLNAANANQINLNYCTGVFLDSVGAFFRVDRIGASSTRVLATVAGVSGTVIPAGSLAKTSVNDQFYAENDITIPSSGSITGFFLSVENGEIPCETNTLTKIISSTSGWDSINNPSAASVGADSESDVLYRARIKASRYSGSGFLEDVKTALESIDDLISSYVYDNGESYAVVYDGITIAGNSIMVLVDGGSDVDVAQAIFDNKSGGCGYTEIQGTSVLTFSGVGVDAETVTVGGHVYTLQTTMAAANDVQIGATANDTAVSLSHAINLDGTEGTDYFAGTTGVPNATSSVTGAGEITVVGGTYGQALVETDSTVATVSISATPQGVTQSVTDGAYDTVYPVTFNRPGEKQIDVEITVKTGEYSGDDLETAVKDAISAWSIGSVSSVDGLVIGQNVSPFEIASAVSIQIPSIYIQSCKIALTGGTAGTDEVAITSSEIARIDTDDITVTVV